MLSDGNGKLHYTSIDGYDNFREKRGNNQIYYLQSLWEIHIFSKRFFYLLKHLSISVVYTDYIGSARPYESMSVVSIFERKESISNDYCDTLCEVCQAG